MVKTILNHNFISRAIEEEDSFNVIQVFFLMSTATSCISLTDASRVLFVIRNGPGWNVRSAEA